MNIPIFLGIVMAEANSIQSGVAPDGPPTDVYTSLYSGVKIEVNWTNGDSAAYSRIYRYVSESWSYIGQADPGDKSYETGYTSGTMGVSHYKNGQETEIVSEVA